MSTPDRAGDDQPPEPGVCAFDGKPRLEGRYVCADCAARIDKAAARAKANAKRTDP
jgi:hypothetical protein